MCYSYTRRHAHHPVRRRRAATLEVSQEGQEELIEASGGPDLTVISLESCWINVSMTETIPKLPEFRLVKYLYIIIFMCIYMYLYIQQTNRNLFDIRYVEMYRVVCYRRYDVCTTKLQIRYMCCNFQS